MSEAIAITCEQTTSSDEDDFNAAGFGVNTAARATSTQSNLDLPNFVTLGWSFGGYNFSANECSSRGACGDALNVRTCVCA